MDRFSELVSEYLDGDLDAAGREELSRLVDADPARRALFVDLVRESSILSVQLGQADPDGFARRVMADLERDKTRFVRAVMSDVRDAGGGGEGEPPRKKRPQPPPGRRPAAPSGPSLSAWMGWGAAAAAALVVLVLLLTSGNREEESRRPDARRKSEPGGVRKESPAPEPPGKKEEPRPSPRPEPPPAPKPEAPAPPPETKVVRTSPETPKPGPEAPKPEPAPSKDATPEKKVEPAMTQVEVAALESVQGEVTIERGGERRPARPQDRLISEDVLQVAGLDSRATLKYADGTTVAFEGDTLSRIQGATGGKRFILERGALRAQVAKQPAGLPMVVATPHGEATVVGTTLRILVGTDPKEGTRLEVEEGKVRLQRKSDGRSIDVPAGFYAVASPGVTLATHPARVTSGLVALYAFKEGRGAAVHDVSRAGTPLDLKIENPASVRWGARALALAAPTLVAGTAPAVRLVLACRSSNELTLEAWIRPAAIAPPGKDGRILTLSSDPFGQDFLLGQDELGGPSRSYFVRLRTTATDLVGKPALASPSGAVQPRLTHLVYTRSAGGGTVLYQDGAEVSRSTAAGDLSAWNETYRVGLGNEMTQDRPWLGEYHLAAVYSRALGADEVRQNLKAGTE